jgi:SAM-dependent methyltransferase
MKLGKEIDLLRDYPKPKRDTEARADSKTEQDREIAKKFGQEFFDGDRKHGYGGFSYNSKYWTPVIPTFIEHFGLTSGSRILDIGCAKGFMLVDLIKANPEFVVKGLDVSEYAINNSHESVRDFVEIGDARSLPYEDNFFDAVISINTIHNLDREECGKALREIERVSKLGSFITVDAYRTQEEKERMFAWNLTAKTIMSVDEWKAFFLECNYSGDFYWFIP